MEIRDHDDMKRRASLLKVLPAAMAILLCIAVYGGAIHLNAGGGTRLRCSFTGAVGAFALVAAIFEIRRIDRVLRGLQPARG